MTETTLNLCNDELKALEKSQRDTQRMINRLEHQEWVRVKRRYAQNIEKDIKEHIEYNQLVNSHFESLTCKQKKLQKLQEIRDREETKNALKEAQKVLQRKEVEKDKDDLKRSAEKSNYLGTLRRQNIEAKQKTKQETAQQKVEFYKLRRRSSVNEDDREIKENLHSRSVSAMNELKVARAKSQHCLRELEHIQKLLNKND